MEDDKRYIVGAVFSNRPSADELAKRLAKKENMVYFVGEVVGEFHPEAKPAEEKRKFTFTEDL